VTLSWAPVLVKIDLRWSWVVWRWQCHFRTPGPVRGL